MLKITPYTTDYEQQVIRLWRDCALTRPWNNPQLDIERRLAIDDGLFLVGVVDEAAVATVMGGYDGHRGRVNYVAVAPAWQGHGFGRQMMACLERKLLARGCPKLNLQVRIDNEQAVRFYEALGYQQDRVLSLGKRLISDQ